MILDKINDGKDLRALSREELPLLAEEVRKEIIEVVSKTGGHLASSLGVVDLTIALHYAFDTPRDRIVWDVGHQAYAHKILTGRRSQFPTLRQHGGLSGFPKRGESPCDHFDVGHASTSISAALGIDRSEQGRLSPLPGPGRDCSPWRSGPEPRLLRRKLEAHDGVQSRRGPRQRRLGSRR